VTKRFDFFGATDDSWIGKLWPRGRAWTNSLSRATLADNFCDRWSGGLNFLRHRYSGSEVPIEPTGDVYPCCIKTRRRSATLSTSRSSKASIRGPGARVRSDFDRSSRAHGPRLRLQHRGFPRASRTRTPGGKPYANLCIGCDAFHEEMLGPVIDRERRRTARTAAE